LDAQYAGVVATIIDKLEGGYYHPNMLADGRVKDSTYAKSGETMFGIDRKQGGIINNSSAGQKFWGLIDSANAANNWKWLYMGGELKTQLESLAAEMMYPLYSQYEKKYLSPQAISIVDSDPRLQFNFIYATWNGEGWFRYFAKKLNAAIDSGITNPDELVKVAVQARTDKDAMRAYGWHEDAISLISRGGEKIASFINSLGSSLKEAGKEIYTAVQNRKYQKIGIGIMIGSVVLFGGAMVLYTVLQKRKQQ